MNIMKNPLQKLESLGRELTSSILEADRPLTALFLLATMSSAERTVYQTILASETMQKHPPQATYILPAAINSFDQLAYEKTIALLVNRHESGTKIILNHAEDTRLEGLVSKSSPKLPPAQDL
jgi:hypothetical protein